MAETLVPSCIRNLKQLWTKQGVRGEGIMPRHIGSRQRLICRAPGCTMIGEHNCGKGRLAPTRRELGKASEGWLEDCARWNGERDRPLIGRRRAGEFWLHRPGVGSETILIVKRVLAESLTIGEYCGMWPAGRMSTASQDRWWCSEARRTLACEPRRLEYSLPCIS